MNASAPTEATPSLLSKRRIVVQLIGFVIGIALLGWCVMIAVRGGDWELVRTADPVLVAGLIGCTLVSLVVNGASFWLVIRPVQRVGFADMQWLNVVTGILNYAPIRAGMIARVAYNLRVDRMSFLRIVAWLGALAYTAFLTIGACIATTVLRPHFDALWAFMVLGLLALGGLFAVLAGRLPLLVRHARGVDRMLSDPVSLWGAIALRLIDVAAFVGRMACAVAILNLSFTTADTLLLGFAALAMGMNPIGRAGFREAAVVFVATRLAHDSSDETLTATMAQLALIDSAGEALVLIPLGLISLIWYRKRMLSRPGVQNVGV